LLYYENKLTDLKKFMRILLLLVLIFTSPIYAGGDLTTQLATFLDNMAKQHAFSGTVVVTKNRDLIFQKSYGQSVYEYHIPWNESTLFDMGSLTGFLTTLCIFHLHEEGLLNISDPVTQYLSPRLVPKANLSQLKILHLLTQTSGLGCFETLEKKNGLSLWDRTNKALFKNLDDYLTLLRSESLEFEPEKVVKPSSSAMLLLGAIIEKVTKKSFQSYTEEVIFKKLRLNNAKFIHQLNHPEAVAIGYKQEKGLRINNLYERPLNGSPSSGAYITMNDLIKLFIGIETRKLLNESTLKLLLSTTIKEEKIELQPFGKGTLKYGSFIQIFQGDLEKPLVVSLSANDPYGSIHIDWMLPNGYSLYIVSNYTKDIEDQIVAKLREIILNN
jgi:CubicO group peptidase (beta-lactamase class C family)